jgi:hypothetical protein
MDLLVTAVADVALLMATARALRAPPAPTAGAAADLRGRRGLRDELRRGAGAYLKTLLRSEQSMADADALAACRAAAEQKMPGAIAAAPALADLMTHESGALEGFASARHDLWRLARLAISVRQTIAANETLEPVSKAARRTDKQLAKRLRKALVRYVRIGVRSEGTTGAAIDEARRAALDELGLSREISSAKVAEAPVAETVRPIGSASSRGLHDLAADWGHTGSPESTGGGVHLTLPMITLDLAFAPVFRRLVRRVDPEFRRAA